MAEHFRFSKRSLGNLQGVHPSLVHVAHKALALSECDFTVTEGLRSTARQRELVAKGASRTMRSYHLAQADGYGHAIDVYPYWGGKLHTEDSKENLRHYAEIARAFKSAATELGVKITWGGDWKSLVDHPHFQIETGER